MSETGPVMDLTVLGEIASGGMGAVELARLADRDGERFVAVKRMHPEYSRDTEFVRMFRDEIWLTGALSHPNVVGLVGFGEDNDGPYLVMEYVDGVALARIALTGRRADEPIPVELVAYAAARAAEGLHAAHILAGEDGRPLDIVHRDVTPSNILVGFDGSVKLTDFGIAKATGKSSHTRTGIIKGKIGYMSPEYAARKPVDGRADLYSLGIVMFELITGKLPFAAKGDLELLKLVAYANTPPLASLKEDVDPELAAIVDHLLVKDPGARLPDGAAVAAALDAWLAARGKDTSTLRQELSDYATRHAGTTRKKLASMLEDDASTVPGDADAPKRPRFETRTFTLFKRPKLRAPRESRPEPDDRPRTRRVAVSGYPPPPSDAPGIPALASGRGVHAARAHSSDDASVDAGARVSHAPPPVTSTSRHSSAVVGGVIVGSVAALVLVIASVLATSREPQSRDEPEPSQAIGATEPALPVSATEEPTQVSALAPEAPTSAASADFSAPAATASAAPKPAKSKPSPQAGKPKPSPGKVTGTNKGTKPCTPDSFDYPGCLKR